MQGMPNDPPAIMLDELTGAMRQDDMGVILDYYNDFVPGARQAFDRFAEMSCDDDYLYEMYEDGRLSPYSCMLLHAAEYGATLIATWLIADKGADMLVRNRDGADALFISSLEGKIAFVRTLLGLYEMKHGHSMAVDYDPDQLFELYQMLEERPNGDAIVQVLQAHGFPEEDED